MSIRLITRLIPWVGVFAVAFFVFYRVKLAPVPVLSHAVTRGSVVAEVMGTGTLEARVKTAVSARIQERLMEVLVDQGDRVTKGQLLARLDDSEAKQQVAIAEASLNAARKTVERVQADLARAQAVLELARLEDQRQRGLVASKAVSQAEADKAVEGLQVAEADQRRSLAATAESESQVLVAEKNLLFRREQLAFTEIVAPYDGLVIRRDRDPGEVLVPGAALLQLASTDELWVSAWVDETASAALRPGQPARLMFRSESGRERPGTVVRLGRETDRETREFQVDVRAAELPTNWTLGQRADVFIETGRQTNGWVVPSAFLLHRDGRPGVWVEEGGRARWTEVTVGLRGMDRVTLETGLAEGTRVVRRPDPQAPPLKDGQRIKSP